MDTRKPPPLIVPLTSGVLSSGIDSPHRRARSSNTYKGSTDDTIPPSASSAQFDHIALASANPFKKRRASEVSITTPRTSMHRTRSRRPSLASSIKSYVSIAHPNTVTVGQSTALPEWIRPWIPLLIWGGISLVTLVLFLIFRSPIIHALETLSVALKEMGIGGIVIMWSMIFITTFPPLSGYSTFITLSGFSFGFVQGFIISYTAALVGAIIVFLLSRAFFQSSMNTLLSKSKSLKGVVRAVEKKGFKLLFLIRLAPYPYNVLNVLLASSPHLTFKTYTIATACALPKLMFHTFLGSSLSSFSEHLTGEIATDENTSNDDNSAAARVRIISFILAAITGVGALVYLFIFARRAVIEAEEEDLHLHDEMEQGVFESDNEDENEKSPLAFHHPDLASYKDEMLSPVVTSGFADMRHRRSPSPDISISNSHSRVVSGHSHDVSIGSSS